jgi:hypothetical protein
MPLVTPTSVALEIDHRDFTDSFTDRVSRGHGCTGEKCGHISHLSTSDPRHV